ncbi:PREDICTED: LOW QUALITY PROTEIN: hydrocephalus-inducing protein-like [Eufriesea mexicana]|uniref:LOW QUALITY PROTEIN: hydrocephalus-inducing protein-like n=1 Tax=Eufriesea mexicana TaxID=516756 RepID=UPI00083C07E4|nr:PREDICTED: LOW QUALITY PROTEIN: hydrocephalus-inducing protein-like [Eufriesea mexicana]
MEDRIAKALLHYYKAREILLPPREPGEPIPWQLVKFYRDTVNEMAEALITEKLEEEEQLGEEAVSGSYERDAAKKSGKARTFASKRKARRAGRSVQRSSARKDSVRGSSHRGKRSEIVSDVSSMDSEGKDCADFLILDETLLDSVNLPTNDPEEIQRLLFCYMDSLRNSSDFRITTRDPVKELLESIERKSDTSYDLPDPSKLKKEKRVCVIFHGAPFTEYQEAACCSAKALEIPVLSIDKAIWEVVALGASSCSIQLRQIIDDAYDSYMEAFAKQKQRLTDRDTLESDEIELQLTRRSGTSRKRRGSPKDRSSRTKGSSKSSRKIKTPKSGKNEDSQKVAILRLRADADPMEELERIPASEKLEMLDPLSRYEYKIQALLSLERLVDHRGIAGSAKDRGDSSPRKRQEASLLGIAPELIAEALQERLSMEDLKRGFVVQSLDSNFLRNNAPRALLSLLQILGNIEYLLFVTFLNSMTCYDSKVRQLQREIEEKASDYCQRIQDIDQMSSSEYDQLPDEDKEMYLHAILPIKREEASRKESVSAEVREIVAAMNRYYTDLSSIENVIHNWDPVKKIMEVHTTKSRVSRSVRSKDMDPPDTVQDVPLNNFHLWYVRSSDPWQDTMYDVVVSQMKENQLAKSALALEKTPEPDLGPKLYSVLRWRAMEKRVRKVYGDVYQLVSLTPITEVYSINESIHVSELSVAENRSNARKGYNRRRQKSGKVEEQKSANKENRSMNESSIESKDTNKVPSLGTVLEEPLKPRWILLPGESQRFKIRFQPEETGRYDETYALTTLGGGNLTYEVNVTGIADIPRLDMNPETIFAKTAQTKLHETHSSTYFYDKGLYDFGSLLLLRKDKRPHRREVRLKFCNVSELEAEVLCSLDENSSECFFVQPQRLLIARGDCATLVLSAIATRLGFIQGKLFLCVTNNPKVEVIELQSEGTKLDIELDEKEVSFGLTLLYRIENRTLRIRNKTPVSLFWHLRAEEPSDPQITFTPLRGLIETRDSQEIELRYHATRVGVVQKKALIFEAFLDEDDHDPIFTDVVLLSGETYDVAVDINNASPIDLKNIRVDFPASAIFSVRNRGDYEVKYVITLQDKEELEKLNLPANFKKNLQVQPATGTVAPNKERIVEMTLNVKTELTLKEAPILKCHLVDTQKETTIIAEIPLSVSLVAYYTRFRINPYPIINFGTLPICSEKTMYLNIENIGSFPLHYSIQLRYRHPSTVYMSQMWPEDPQKRQNTPEKGTSRKGRSVRSSKTETKARPEPEMLTLGPMTITKMKGNVEVGQTDSIAISCYPEFVGSQEEQITVVVADSVPEDRDGKTVTLSVNSAIPSIDFQDLDSIFQENHVVDGIQDFDCPRDIGPHTVFARREKCLHFRYVNVLSTHVTCFKLHNRGMVPASVEIRFLDEALRPSTAKENTFVVEPGREQVPPMSHKVFTVSFTPHVIETFQGAFQATVVLPPHLEPEQLFIKLIGESCVPEVAITEPAHGARERPTLNFVRTLIDESSCRYFTVENVGFIKAKVIIEIDEDLNNVFLLSACLDIQHLLQAWEEYCDDPQDRCTAVRLASGNAARFKVIFNPRETGKHCGKIRLHVVDNPYENLTINLEGECYVESIVLNGLQSEDNNRKVSAGNRDAHRSRRFSSKQNSQASASSNSTFPVSLTYILDYGLCFVSKIYRKTFKIVNKSTDRWFRFQWSVHPHVVFVPSIGHVKYLTCKEIVATFLASEPTNHENIRIECFVCEILVEDVTVESAWDDRQTEVRWERIHHDIPEQISNLELLSKKIIEPTIEARHEVVPGTSKSILLLLNATVAFSRCTSTVQEICFKDTLMFQIREYTFLLANPGTVNTVYAWKINMDEQYPKRRIGDASNVTSRSRFAEESRSRQYSRSSRGIFSATSETRGRCHEQGQRSVEESSNVLSRQCSSFESESGDAKATSSTKPSDLFSSAAALSGRTTDSWLEGDDLPFVIYPETGTIPPGESMECTLKFSPKDVFYYKAYLACRIENIEPGQPTLTIPVSARSLLPYCHFDVQESDYVTSNRRDPSLPGPLGYEIDDPALWQNIRVIEFKVVGVGETHVKKFHLINPTMDDYHFSWTNRTVLGTDEVPNFQCTVTEGIAERGKRTDLAFTFLAEQVGVFESFWLFSISRYNLECLFLVVGVVAEPSVHCLTVHVKLKPTILGFNVRDSAKLLNNEDFHIPFRIVEDSLYSEGKFQKLSVTPMTGSLVSKSEQHFWVEYHPTRVGEFNFSVQCAVKLMKSPLTIFVTACVYDIVSSVSYCKPNDEVVRASENKENVIDLGKLMPEVPVAVKFDITNSCKVAFYYTWQLGMTPDISCRNAYSLTVSQKQGHVISDDRSTCYLTMTTFQKVTIKDHCVLLKIANGPTYKFILKAFSKRPAIEFSFNRHDFGLCYIQDSNSISYRTELRVTNSDEVPFVIECKFEELPHLSVDLSSTYEALAAGSSIAVPIVFRPLRETRYSECLMFAINSVNVKKITITGEGIGYKVRLANPRDKSVDLGSISASRCVTKRIPVVNEGLAPLDLRFGLLKDLSGYEEHRERHGLCDFQVENASEMARASIMETKRSWTNDERLETVESKLSDVLRIEPSSNVTLKPNNRVNVVVTFKPTSRMRPFSAKVALQTSSTILPMFLVRGSCVGAEFHLNRTHIPFGTVVQGCVEESKMILMNTGDLGSRFKWNTSKLPRDFQISPTSGYCSAGMDVSFVVKFQPSEQRSLIEGEATIEIEKHESLKMKITGACCKLPEPIETIRFECLVRGKQTRSVVIMNDSHLPWKLKAEVTGSHFSVNEMLQVPPQQLASCIVTYSPLAMNTENTLHTGTLVLKSQDENLHLLYSLRGRSLPPEVTAKISRRFPAKTKYTELLPVLNWLNSQQRFQCQIKLLPAKSAHVNLLFPFLQRQTPLYSFVGNERFDVPSNSQRDYRAVFYCYEKWNFHFKVTFTNEEGEYQFYEIEYEVSEPEVMESIKLTTPARFQICHALKVENPLEHGTITFTAECFHPFVTLSQVPKTVKPLSHDFIYVLYQPTLPLEESAMLMVYGEKLGRFLYELRLKATPAPPHKITRVNATLGNSHAFSLPVNNLTKRNARFLIEVDSECFACPASIFVRESSEGVINVIYEPYDVENVTAMLIASSDTAGEFAFPLVGSCTPPKPTGPYVITRTSSAIVRFKNVFRETKTFGFMVDVPETFTIDTESVVLDPKQSIGVKVSIREDEQDEEEFEGKYPVTGKLMVYCTDPVFSHINWVYYLRAVFE